MKICEILRVERIISSLRGATKAEVIDELINLFKDDERVNNLEGLRSAVHEREDFLRRRRVEKIAILIPARQSAAPESRVFGPGVSQCRLVTLKAAAGSQPIAAGIGQTA